MTTIVTDASFQSEVLGAHEPVLVDFSAEWCAPCRAMDPLIDDLSREFVGRVKIVRLDVDANPSTTVRYGVRSMPTMIVFKDGTPADMRIGAGQSRAQLVKWLESYAA